LLASLSSLSFIDACIYLQDEKEESQATEIYTDNQAPAVDAQHVVVLL
jgi:hypothetical protein